MDTQQAEELPNPGADKLRAWIDLQRERSTDSVEALGVGGWVWSMTKFAQQVGVSRQMVRNWIIGLARPMPDHRDDIERATGGEVPADVWD